PATRALSGPMSCMCGWRMANAAPRIGGPCRTRMSCRRSQEMYRSADALGTGGTLMFVFVVEPQPKRITGVFRPVVSRNRRRKVIVIEKRRIHSYECEIVSGKLSQHGAHGFGVRQ